MKYQSMLTAIGKAKLMAAQAKGEHVQLKEFAVGSGTEVISEAQQTLQKEEWRGAITNIAVDSKDKNVLDVETVIPANEGGFFIKEFGVFDDAGDLIIVGNTPESYKPLLEAGAASSMRIISKTIISNAADVTLLMDENALYVTYEKLTSTLNDIKDYTSEHLTRHIENKDIHVTTVEKKNWHAKETPEGAQKKADQALLQAKEHTLSVSDALLIQANNHANEVGKQVLSDAKKHTTESGKTLDLSNNPQVKTLEGDIKKAQKAADEAFQSGNKVKNQLVTTLLSKQTLPITKNDSWDKILSVMSQSLAVRQKATGNITTEGAQSLIVTGLKFKPTVILVYRKKHIHPGGYYHEELGDKWNWGSTKQNFGVAKVTYGSFELENHVNYKENFGWVAYE